MSIIDASTTHLLQQLHHGTNSLWLADENSYGIWPALAAYAPNLQLMSNRFDLVQAAQNSAISATFSDWQFDADSRFDAIFLRICKEKAVNQHLIRSAFLHLNNGGQLQIAGAKNEGIKSIWEYAGRIFQDGTRLKKHGLTYAGAVNKVSEHSIEDADLYHHLHMIGEWEGMHLYSKPGVYGWDKIDAGSALLIDCLRHHNSFWSDAESVLDLGCGYGFLTVASHWLPCKRRVATDNNAGALLCMEKNAREHKLAVEVVAADKANRVSGTFDLILCNPPFHRGFDVDGDMTRDFLIAAKQKLADKGTALFVVNSFIPLEKKLGGLFHRAQLLADNRQFKVLALQH